MQNLNFNLPFSFNKLGQVDSTTDTRRIWQNRVILCLTSRFGERLMRPDFGSDISLSLFETPSNAAEMIDRAVNITFNTWLTSLKLIKVMPIYDETTGYMDVSIEYSLPSGDIDKVTFNTAIFSRSGDLIQEIPNG